MGNTAAQGAGSQTKQRQGDQPSVSTSESASHSVEPRSTSSSDRPPDLQKEQDSFSLSLTLEVIKGKEERELLSLEVPGVTVRTPVANVIEELSKIEGLPPGWQPRSIRKEGLRMKTELPEDLAVTVVKENSTCSLDSPCIALDDPYIKFATNVHRSLSSTNRTRLKVSFEPGGLRFGPRNGPMIAFCRTFRLPPGSAKPSLSPSSLSSLLHNPPPRLQRISSIHGAQLPQGWQEGSGVLLPVQECEALTLSFFCGASPVAVQVFSQGRNLLNGEPAKPYLIHSPTASFVMSPPNTSLPGLRRGLDEVLWHLPPISQVGSNGHLSLEIYVTPMARRDAAFYPLSFTHPPGDYGLLSTPEKARLKSGEKVIMTAPWIPKKRQAVLGDYGINAQSQGLVLVGRQPGLVKVSVQSSRHYFAVLVNPEISSLDELKKAVRVKTGILEGDQVLKWRGHVLQQPEDAPDVLSSVGIREDVCVTLESSSLEGLDDSSFRLMEDLNHPPLWDIRRSARVLVRLVTPELYAALTGIEAESSPLTKKHYVDAGIPWPLVENASKSDKEVISARGDEADDERDLSAAKLKNIEARRKQLADLITPAYASPSRVGELASVSRLRICQNMNELGGRLFEQVIAQEDEENVVLSPLLLHTLLPLFLSAATEDIRSRVVGLAKFNDPTEPGFIEHARTLNRFQIPNRVHLAMGFWKEQHIVLGDKFYEVSQELGVSELPGDSLPAQAINDWVTSATNGGVTCMVDHWKTDMDLVPLTAAYVSIRCGGSLHTTESGENSSAVVMSSPMHYWKYSEVGHCIGIPLGDLPGLDLYLLLPLPSTSVDICAQWLCQNLHEFGQHAVQRNVRLVLSPLSVACLIPRKLYPHCHISHTGWGGSAFQALDPGMDQKRWDCSALLPVGGRCFVSEVLHRARLVLETYVTSSSSVEVEHDDCISLQVEGGFCFVMREKMTSSYPGRVVMIGRILDRMRDVWEAQFGIEKATEELEAAEEEIPGQQDELNSQAMKREDEENENVEMNMREAVYGSYPRPEIEAEDVEDVVEEFAANELEEDASTEDNEGVSEKKEAMELDEEEESEASPDEDGGGEASPDEDRGGEVFTSRVEDFRQFEVHHVKREDGGDMDALGVVNERPKMTVEMGKDEDKNIIDENVIPTISPSHGRREEVEDRNEDDGVEAELPDFGDFRDDEDEDLDTGKIDDLMDLDGDDDSF